MEVARLTTVADWDGRDLTRGLQQGAAAGGVFAQAMVGALASVSAAAIKVGLVMDDALDTIRIRTGQTGAALEGLGDSFRGVFRAGPDGAQQVSDALSTLRTRTTQTGEGLEALTTQVLTLSRITKTDLNSNVAESARLFTSWGIAAAEQGNSLDLLFRTSQQTGVGVDQLLAKMVTAGPTFRAAGFDFATSAALLGGFEQAGVSAERVISGMGRAFNFFSKEGINAQKGVQQTIARIQELGPGAEAAALGVKVFGRGAVDMVAAIQSGRLNVEALVTSISDGTDTIEAAAKATDGFTENLAILGKRAFLALEPFGTAILETFNKALLGILSPSRALTDALHRLSQAAALVGSVYVGRMVPAIALATRTFVAARIAAIAHTAALVRNALAAGTLTAAAGALRVALAFFGGPIGLAVTAVLGAISLGFLDTGRKARQAAAQARQAAEEFRDALSVMGDAELLSAGARATRILTVQARGRASVETEITNINQNLAAIEESARRRGHMTASEARTAARLSETLRTNNALLAEAQRRENVWYQRVTEVNAAYRQRQSIVQSVGADPVGPLAWEGNEEKGKTAVELLRERIDLLAAISESELEMGRVATDAQRSLIAEYQRAEGMLASMGEAAHLPTSALESYRTLLEIVNQFRPETVRPTDRLRAALPTFEAGTAAEQVAAVNARSASQFVEVQANRIRNAGIEGARAFREGAKDAADRMREITSGVRSAFTGLIDSLPGLSDARTGFNAARGAGAGVAGSVAAGAGMAVAMEFLAGVAESLGPALEALLLPVRMLGEVFGRALVPIVRALFPVFRLVAIAATYVGEAFFRSTAAIQIAVGGLLRGIGRVLNLLPGSIGNPLIEFGQTLINVGRGFQEGADELARARGELEDLTFDDAVDRVNNGLDRLAESLSNVPPVFDLVLRRMQAGRATGSAGSPAPSPAPPLTPPTGGSGGGSQPVNVTYYVTVEVDGRAASTDREFLRFVKDGIRRGLEGNDVELQNAARTAVLGKR